MRQVSLPRGPAQERELKDRAHALVLKGKLKEAVELYRGLVVAQGRDASVRLRHAELCRKAGLLDEAVASYLLTAQLLENEGHLNRARAVLTSALQIAPGEPMLVGRLRGLSDALRDSPSAPRRSPPPPLALVPPPVEADEPFDPSPVDFRPEDLLPEEDEPFEVVSVASALAPRDVLVTPPEPPRRPTTADRPAARAAQAAKASSQDSKAELSPPRITPVTRSEETARSAPAPRRASPARTAARDSMSTARERPRLRLAPEDVPFAETPTDPYCPLFDWIEDAPVAPAPPAYPAATHTRPEMSRVRVDGVSMPSSVARAAVRPSAESKQKRRPTGESRPSPGGAPRRTRSAEQRSARPAPSIQPSRSLMNEGRITGLVRVAPRAASSRRS